MKESNKNITDIVVKAEDQKVGIKGVYTFTKAKIETAEQWALHDKIKALKNAGKGYMHLVRDLNDMCKIEITVVDNIVPTVGRAMLADNLTNSSPTDAPRINYTALGSGDTAVSNSDVQLVTEVFRKTTASGTNADNVAYVTAFYDATETTGTYKEAGLFSNGTASADSGVLFSRVLLSAPTGIVKSSTETLTIDYTLTIS